MPGPVNLRPLLNTGITGPQAPTSSPQGPMSPSGYPAVPGFGGSWVDPVTGAPVPSSTPSDATGQGPMSPSGYPAVPGPGGTWVDPATGAQVSASPAANLPQSPMPNVPSGNSVLRQVNPGAFRTAGPAGQPPSQPSAQQPAPGGGWFEAQGPPPAPDYDALMTDSGRRRVIEALFQKYLGRQGSPSEIYTWYKGNDSLPDIEQKIKASDEAYTTQNYPATPGQSTSATPSTGAAGGATKSPQEAQGIAQQMFAQGKISRGNLQPLADALGPGWYVTAEDGIGNNSLGEWDIVTSGGQFTWLPVSDGKVTAANGGRDPVGFVGSSGGGGGTSLGDLAGAFGSGGFGSGTFNFPQFQGNTQTAAPFTGTVPQIPAFQSTTAPMQAFQNTTPQNPAFQSTTAPMAAFQNTTPQNPAFTSPVGQVPTFTNQVAPVGTFTNPTQPIGTYATPADFPLLSQAQAGGGSSTDFQAPAAFTGLSKDEFQNTPGYQWDLSEGMKALERSSAAKGTLLTTGTLKALQGYATGLADQTYGEAYNRAQGTQAQNFNQALAGYGTNQNTNQANVGNKLNAFNANLAGTQANFGNALGTFNANLSGNAQNFGQALSTAQQNAANNAQNYGQAANAYGLNLQGNQANFGNDLAAYNANQGTQAQNFGQGLSAYNANVNANQANFGNDLASYGANQGTQAQNFGQDLSSYNANANTTQSNFNNPFAVWQAQNLANQQNYANQLGAYGTNYNTASGIHNINIGDLLALLNYGTIA